jgi:Flp pilus assembly protein TadG
MSHHNIRTTNSATSTCRPATMLTTARCESSNHIMGNFDYLQRFVRSRMVRPGLAACSAGAVKSLREFLGNKDGASIIIVGLTLPALIGAMGLAIEVSYWRLHQRAMQNASDAAAIAAATNGGLSYAAEGQAVAAQYGFQNGTKNITVTVSNPSTAPGCTANCYTTAISDQVPLFLSQVVGYKGSKT